MNETEQYLEEIVIDVCSRSFLLCANDGDEKVIECDNIDEFMGVFELVKERVDDEAIFYSDIVVKKES